MNRLLYLALFTCSLNAQSIRIACGLPTGTQSITDQSGQSWTSDANYTNGGSPWTVSPAPANPVYQHLRYSSTALIYSIPVPNGQYTLTLKFIEPTLTTAGGRLFSATANGQPVTQALDLYAVAKQQPFDVSMPLAISTGSLYLVLTTQIRNAVIAGIDIEPVQPTVKISCPTPTSCTGIVLTTNPDGTVAIAANTASLMTRDAEEQGQCKVLNSSNGTSSYTASLAPQCLALQSMTPGMMFLLHPDVANASGSAMLDIDGRGTHSIKLLDGTTDPAPNSIQGGGYYWIVFDGTVWRLL